MRPTTACEPTTQLSFLKRKEPLIVLTGLLYGLMLFGLALVSWAVYVGVAVAYHLIVR